jgi:hypothetical protein
VLVCKHEGKHKHNYNHNYITGDTWVKAIRELLGSEFTVKLKQALRTESLPLVAKKMVVEIPAISYTVRALDNVDSEITVSTEATR